jgi:hypothetical protein
MTFLIVGLDRKTLAVIGPGSSVPDGLARLSASRGSRSPGT